MALATRNGQFQPNFVAKYPIATADTAPPRLPSVFITAVTEPL